MLDLGLSKIAIIGVVALVVIGPEKLPRVARTIGTLVGRAQRYINDVKSEVAREMDLGDLKQAKSQFEDAARGMNDAARTMHSSVNDGLRQTENDLNETWRSMSPEPSPGSEAASTLAGGAVSNPSGYSVYDEPASSHTAWQSSSTNAYEQGVSVGRGVKRRNWRIKQSTPPVWFKRTQLVRTRLQSGAARVARHRPDSLRQPTRFL